MTNSLRSFAAFSKPSSLIGPFSKIICIIPLLSRRSTKANSAFITALLYPAHQGYFFPDICCDFRTAAGSLQAFHGFSHFLVPPIWNCGHKESASAAHRFFMRLLLLDIPYILSTKILRSQCSPRWQAALSWNFLFFFITAMLMAVPPSTSLFCRLLNDLLHSLCRHVFLDQVAAFFFCAPGIW